MRTHKKRKLPRWLLGLIISLSVLIVLIVALLITDAFIPVKYLSAYCVSSDKNKEGELRITYMDVGMGDCTLIELPDGKTVLIDGGNGEYSNNLKILKTLNKCGVDEIDYLICTSVSGEHCGGLSEIIKYKTVKKAFVPYSVNRRLTNPFYDFMEELEERGIPYETACVGVGVAEEKSGYFFTFLSPSAADSQMGEYFEMNLSPTAENIDNASVVTWFEFEGEGFVFCSDVREQTLKRMLFDYSVCTQAGDPYCAIGAFSVELEKCSVMTLPLHGGKKGAYLPWNEKLSAQLAIVSSGKAYVDAPSAEAVANAQILSTIKYTMYDGDVVIRRKGTQIFL